MATTTFIPNTVGELLAYPDHSTRHFNEIKRENSPYYNHKPIKYNATSNEPVTTYGDEKWLELLVNALNKCGIECKNTGSYDLQMEQAVSKFQSKYMTDHFWYMPSSESPPVVHGVLDDKTVKQIFIKARDIPDVIEEEPVDDTSNVDNMNSDVDSPHYNSFFDTDNTKQFRQNHNNIKIVFGNSGIVKELHDVIMRSVGVEVDTSGNPISETYEFIARDVTESDEEKDSDNYINNNGLAPSDILYKFNFKK